MTVGRGVLWHLPPWRDVVGSGRAPTKESAVSSFHRAHIGADIEQLVWLRFRYIMAAFFADTAY